MKKVYKLLEVHGGKLYPLYVNAKEETPIHEWLEAKCGEITEEGKVKAGKLKKLAFRPGWHTSRLPYAPHIGKKVNGEIMAMHDNQVWCECFIKDEVNYQEKADKNGRNAKGVVIPKKAYLKEIPRDGYYAYKTNASMIEPWYISGELFVSRVLTDEQVDQILKDNNIAPIKRMGEFPSLEETYFTALIGEQNNRHKNTKI